MYSKAFLLHRKRSTKFMMEESQFDVEYALSRNTILPPIIPSLESEADEHEDVVADPAPPAAPPGSKILISTTYVQVLAPD